MKLKFYLFAALATGCVAACSTKQTSNKFTDNQIVESAVENSYAEQYPKAPDAEKFTDAGPDGTEVLSELKARYKEYLKELKDEVEATGAKFVIMQLTPDLGEKASPFNKTLTSFVISTARELDADFIDLTPVIAKYKSEEITQYPNDGHWSKEGSQIVSSAILKELSKYQPAKNTKTYSDAERSATFGDLEPNSDEILDGGKNLPYHVVANKQGLRNNYDVTFPKKKQRFLFLGDSEIYCPFLDNEFTIPALLEKASPDKEFLNSGIIGYTIDDYLSLFRDKGKFSEPDVVIICTNPEDISDLYFSNRNKFSRTHRVVQPTKAEQVFYENFMAKK